MNGHAIVAQEFCQADENMDKSPLRDVYQRTLNRNWNKTSDANTPSHLGINDDLRARIVIRMSKHAFERCDSYNITKIASPRERSAVVRTNLPRTAPVFAEASITPSIPPAVPAVGRVRHGRNK